MQSLDDLLGTFFELLTAVGDPLAGLVAIAVLMLYRPSQRLHKSLRTALIVASCGLIGQGYRSYLAITSEISLSDHQLAWTWAFKDIGLWMIFISLAYCIYKNKLVIRK